MTRISAEDRQALRERERYLESGGRPDRPLAVRAEITASWQRSLDSLVNPSGIQPDFQRLGDTQLSAAALPVIDHHLRMLADTRTSLLFADAQGRLIGRWTHDSSLRSSLARSFVEAGFTMSEAIVGTNGVGTVFESGAAVEIKGPEHFSEQYLPFTCVGAPIRHPLTRRMIGAIDITCRDEDSSALAMPWIVSLARHIEDQLLERVSTRERALLDAYLAIARRSQIAVACLNGAMLISNPAASALLTDADQAHLWTHLKRIGFRTVPVFAPVELAGGRVLMIRARAVRRDALVIGAVIEAYELPAAEGGRLPALPAGTKPALAGLVGLSDRWTNVCEQAQRWRHDRGGVVVTGEPGVGKLAVLRSALAEPGPFTVLDCTLVAVDGPQSWLAALRDRLGDPEGLLVLRHVETLQLGVAQAICSMLDVAPQPPRLAATITEDGVNEPHAPLTDRFEVHRLAVPPLRHRLDDLDLLLAALTRTAAGGEGAARWLPEAVHLLAEHRWPDNVRGLGALVRRVTRNRAGAVVAAADLPDDFVARQETRRPLSQLERLERQEIIEALNASGGNKALAAQRLNFARSTLYRKIATLGIRAVPARR